MVRRKICVVTGSRADYGLLRSVMDTIRNDPELVLQTAVTGSHLSPEFGLTYRAIEADGFSIDVRVDSLLSGDTPVAVAKSIGLGVIGFADAFDQLQPDIIVLLGDRFEILAAAQAAMIATIPVAHVAGGDVTEGAFDDAIRHSITKMSHIHFVTNVEAENRVRQLGEDPRNVHHVGSPGLDTLARAKLLSRQELETALGFAFKKKNLLVTFHPATLDREPSAQQLSALLDALDRLGLEFGIIFTKANADTEGRVINRMIEMYVSSRLHCRCFDSLGQQQYLSVMAVVDVVVGNSSSGLYEAPSLKKPAVNIGDRQAGRLRASSVIDCAPQASAIERAIRTALTLDCSTVKNPYGNGKSAEKIVAVLKAVPDLGALIKKRFVDVQVNFA